jgi:hypothetical protein
MRVIIVGGSFEYYHTWYYDRHQPFCALLEHEGFDLIDPVFRWNGGILPVDWEAAGEALWYCCRTLPYLARNFICYSNGGLVALECAARRGFDMRTLTTVGTPYRYDVPIDTAEDRIGYHQAIYDECDPVRHAGEWDWAPFGQRRFARARNYDLFDIQHGKVFFEPAYINYWVQMGWLAAIRDLETPAEKAGQESATWIH